MLRGNGVPGGARMPGEALLPGLQIFGWGRGNTGAPPLAIGDGGAGATAAAAPLQVVAARRAGDSVAPAPAPLPGEAEPAERAGQDGAALEAALRGGPQKRTADAMQPEADGGQEELEGDAEVEPKPKPKAGVKASAKAQPKAHAKAKAKAKTKVKAKAKSKPKAKAKCKGEAGDGVPAEGGGAEGGNKKFMDVPKYGTVRAEFYSKKSYIREALADGRWRMIIGDTSPRHVRVCELLLPHVLLGKSRDELRTMRYEIAGQLGV